MAVYFMQDKFLRTHQTLQVTPAMTAGVTPKPWEMSDMVAVLENGNPSPVRPITRWLQIGAALLVALVTAGVVKTIGTGIRQSNTFDTTRDAPAMLQMLKVEMDKKLPMRTDSITTLIGFDVDATRVRYRYLIDKPMSAIDVSQFRSTIQRTLVDGFCNRSEMEIFRRMNVQMEYLYRASDGGDLADITFTNAVCQNGTRP